MRVYGIVPLLLAAIVLFGGCARHIPSSASAEPLTGFDLRCWNDSESKYTVEGANLFDPSFGTKRTSLETQFDKPATSSHWPPRARVRIGAVSAPDFETTRSVRAAIRPLRVGLRACHERSREFDRASRYHLTVRLHWTKREHVAVAILDEQRRPPVAADLWNCMTTVLSAADWPPLATGTELSAMLHVSAQ
ncbi:MAG: hypothetical protein ACRBN8_25785 [Nannocystales bacterium]